MFKRKINDHLIRWSKQKQRKPLVIRGARQVGKTTTVHQFAENFNNYLYLNLDLPAERKIFERELSTSDLLQALFIEKNINPAHGSTLIFIDEIQNSPRAVSYLRYFYEEFPDYYFIAAGSLLEIMLASNTINFPVGRVEFCYLYPLSFEEYLLARDKKLVLEQYNTLPVSPLAHPQLIKLFHDYSLIGGMPEVLVKFLESGNMVEAQGIMDNLMTAFTDDFRKYAKSSAAIGYLMHVIDTAPLFAGQRIKFAGFGNSTYRYRKMAEALRTLEQAMLVTLLYPTTTFEPPLRPDIKKSPKLQFFDTGLMNFRAGLQSYFYKFDDLHNFHRGLVAEHIVYQEIIASDLHTNRKPLFWVREERRSSAEVDYLLNIDSFLIPVEVKSGATGRLRSLQQFIDGTNHRFAIRLYAGPLKIDDLRTVKGKSYRLLNLPYYLAGKLNDYGHWFINLGR